MNYLKLTTYRAGLLQARAYRNLSGFMTRTLVPYGLAVTEWAMLGLLKDTGDMRPSELSAQLGVSNPLISRHIKRLSDLSWVKRIGDDTDARGAVISLTAAGTEMVDTIESQLRRDMRQYLKGISLRQLASYLAVLEQLATREV